MKADPSRNPKASDFDKVGNRVGTRLKNHPFYV